MSIWAGRGGRRAGRFAQVTLPLAIVLSLWVSPALAQEVEARREHRVREGDTLWDLADHYLSDPFAWGRIWEVNRGIVRNPHLIYPNDLLLIPDRVAGFRLTDGLPLVGAGPDRTLFYRGLAALAEGGGGEVLEEGEVVEVSPVRPGEFIAAPWLAERDRLEVIGRVLRIRGHGGGRDRITQSVHPQDRVYLQYRGRGGPGVGDTLVLVREGRRLRSWGRVYEPGGLGVVEEVSGGVAVVAVVRQFGRLGPGDLAVGFAEFPGVPGRAERVDDGVRASLVGFVADEPVYGTTALGFVDLGSRDGVSIGDEFEVYRPARSSGGWFSPTLPEERLALARVIRVEARTATVRVVELYQSSLRPGLPVRLVGKMP